MELEQELAAQDIVGIMTPEEMWQFAVEVYHCVGYLEEFPNHSMKELADAGVATFYFGLVTTLDRFSWEPIRFLCSKDPKNRPPLVWSSFPFDDRRIDEDEAIDLLHVKSVLIRPSTRIDLWLRIVHAGAHLSRTAA